MIFAKGERRSVNSMFRATYGVLSRALIDKRLAVPIRTV